MIAPTAATEQSTLDRPSQSYSYTVRGLAKDAYRRHRQESPLHPDARKLRKQQENPVLHNRYFSRLSLLDHLVESGESHEAGCGVTYSSAMHSMQ